MRGKSFYRERNGNLLEGKSEIEGGSFCSAYGSPEQGQIKNKRKKRG